MATLRVKSTTKPSVLAGAISGELRREGKVEALAVGAGAVSQLVKACAVARGYLAASGRDLHCKPSFFETTNESMGGIVWTGISFLIEMVDSK